MAKYTAAERSLVRNIIATLSLKRIPESEIIDEIFRQTNKRLSHSGFYNIKQGIKRDSYRWYTNMREGQHEYIHEFRERISEIMDLQKKHHAILDSPTEPTPVKQASMVELHKLCITLSNLYDVAPAIISNGNAISITSSPETNKAATTTREFIV